MLKTLFPTLGRFRFTVQIAMLFVTVYGGALLGSYTVDRISQALPALSCAYDKMTGDHCILIVNQHQFHHRVGEALVKAQDITLKVFIPTLMSVGVFFMFFFFLNKAFCGWVCPLGTVQELLYRIGRRLGRPLNRFTPANVGRVRPVKWLMLLVLVLALPTMAGMGVVGNELGDPFCQVCPSRIATTLLTADTEQIAVRTGTGINLFLGAAGNALFGFIIIAALAARQPFCRICPLLSWNALFQKLSPMRLVKKQHDKCEKCGVCENACPMDIHEIGTRARQQGVPRGLHPVRTLRRVLPGRRRDPDQVLRHQAVRFLARVLQEARETGDAGGHAEEARDQHPLRQTEARE